MKHIKHMRLMAIPKPELKEQSVSVHRFKKIAKGDLLENLAGFQGNSDEVSIFLQDVKHSSINTYLTLLDNPGELIAVEIKGYVDIELTRLVGIKTNP